LARANAAAHLAIEASALGAQAATVEFSHREDVKRWLVAFKSARRGDMPIACRRSRSAQFHLRLSSIRSIHISNDAAQYAAR
jgi:hypothetical protein